MRNKRLQSQVTAGRWTLPAVIFICALCWVLTYFLFPGSIASTVLEGSPSAWQPARDFLLPGWADRIVSFLIYATIGYFLIELNNQFSIIRMRASMQTAIYFLLVTVCPKCITYIQEILLPWAFSFPFIFCLKAISKLKLRVIYSTPSSLSEREVFCSHSSPSSRCFGCSKPTVSSRSLRVVSAVRCSDGCCHTGCCSDTPSSTTRWSCSIALSISY